MTRFLFVVVRSNLWALCYINLHVLNVDCLLFVGCMVAHKSLFFWSYHSTTILSYLST